MADRWVCRSCWAANEERWDKCFRCGVPRGTEPSAETGAGASAVGAAPSTTESSSPWWKTVPMRFAGVGVFAAIAIFGAITAATRDDSGAITGAGTMHISDVRVGDCFDVNEGPDAEEVGDIRAIPCDEPHTFEAYFATDLPAGDYPSRTALDTAVEDACLPAFEPYVGRDYQTSELYVSWFEPTPEGWREGDRELLCVISTEDAAETLTGSVRNSGR